MSFSESEIRSRRAALAVQCTGMEIYWFTASGRIVDANPAACQALGYALDDLTRRLVFDLDPACSPVALDQALAVLNAGQGPLVIQSLHRRSDGSFYPVEVTLASLDGEEGDLYCAFVRDITEHQSNIKQISLYKDILDSSVEAIFWIHPSGKILYVNEAAAVLVRKSRPVLMEARVQDIIAGSSLRLWEEHWADVRQKRHFVAEALLVLDEDTLIHVEISSRLFHGPDGGFCVSFVRDVSATKKHIRDMENLVYVLGETQKMANIGYYEYNFKKDQIHYSDYVRSMFGLTYSATGSYESWLDLIHPEDRERIDRYVKEEVFERRRGFDAHYRIIRPKDGQVRWMHGRGEMILNDQGEAVGMIGPIQDITERKLAQDQIQNTVDALTRSNVELERFAYVASHDLQEPIRNIVAYSQLLGQRYRGRLDDDADEFLGYIIGGAKRMHALVLDLLAYSRLSAGGQPFRMLDVARVVGAVCDDLRMAIRDSGARITTGSLPMVYGDEIQLVALFQNLIGNAIKFRRPDVIPSIHVGARRGNRAWVLEVTDNGIGMDPAYLEKIFVIFKRLHTAQAYPGTGIGLAVAKRIVERHGGAIHVESAPGEGSRFFVTLPDPVG